MSKTITQLLDEHMESDERNFSRILDELKLIKENHLHHIENDLRSISSDMDWIKKFFWLFASVSISAIFGQIIVLLLSNP